MATRKIFVVSGEESSKEESSTRRNGNRARIAGVTNIKFMGGLHVLSILCCCGLAMSVLTLIPRHNSILDQSYWFEINIVMAMKYFIATAVVVLDIIVLFEKNSWVPTRFFLKNFLATFSTWIIFYCATYMIWTMVLEYNHPMPFFHVILSHPTKMVSGAFLLLMLLREFSHDDESKKKLKHFVLFQFGWIMNVIIKLLLIFYFKASARSDAQCAIALLIPISQMLLSFVLSKLMNRMVGNDNDRANFTLDTQINLSYNLFTANTLVGGRSATGTCVQLVEMLLDLIMIYQIVKLHNQVSECENETSKKKKRDAILSFVLTDLCDGLVSLAYSLSFAMANFGPNAGLLGYVKNDFWHWTLIVMSAHILIDMVVFLFGSWLIWKLCKVNLFKESCSVIKKYWYIFAVNIVSEVWGQFYIDDVNFANDFTFRFGWIKNSYNVNFISN